MRCGRRWPPMTRCCAGRLRRTAASCSSTPATGCAPPSRHPRSAVDAAVAAQRVLELPVRMGLATGEAELREGDYFGAVLNRAARVMAAGSWRAGSARRYDGRSVQQHRPDCFGATAITGHRQTRSRCSRSWPSGLRREFPPLDDARRGTGKPAPSNDELHRTRSRTGRGARGAEGSSAGDVDRGGRGRQDPPGDRSRGAAGRRVSRTASGCSNWPRSPIRRRCPMRWRRCWASPSSRG